MLKKILREVVRFLTPLEIVSTQAMRRYSWGLVALLLILWTFVKLPFIPKFGDTLSAFGTLWTTRGLFGEILTSLKLNFYALGASSCIAFGLGYLSTIPAIRPIVIFCTKLRFLGFTGLVFLFSLYIGTGFRLKMSLMLFAVTWFYLMAIVAIVRGVTDDRIEYGYTMRMGRWRTLWEIVILGTLHETLGVLLQFAGYGWAILTAVEGLSRSQGGIGVMILNSDKYLRIEDIFAMALAIFIVGVVIDLCGGVVIRRKCAYAFIKIGRRA
ncbi:MAG: hypothetical protein WCV85_06230 [Patescibacteria group bacterium]|jgi:NitT/TauT family transport system permease protein